MTERPAAGRPGPDEAVPRLPVPLGPLDSAARARRFGSWYYAEYWLLTLRSYGWTVAMTAVGTPLVYLFAMGIGLAALVDRNPGSAAGYGEAASYLVFIAPALLATQAVLVASEENSYPVMAGFKWRYLYYGPNASPLASRQLVNGHSIGVALRILLTSVVYYLFLLLFGAVPQPGAGWGMVLTASLGGMAFGLPLMAYASGLLEDKGQFAMVQRLVVMPLFLFSGTFFPLDAMPLAVRWIGWISPLWHSTELGRVLAYGYPEPVWLSALHLLFLAALAVAGWRLAIRNFERRLGR